MPPPDPNNTYTKPLLEIQILEFIKTLSYDEDPKTKMIAVVTPPKGAWTEYVSEGAVMMMTMMLRVVAVVRWWLQGDDEDGDINGGSVMEIVDLWWYDAAVGWPEVSILNVLFLETSTYASRICGGGDDGRMMMTMMLRVVVGVRWWQQGDDEDGDINGGSVMEIVDLWWHDTAVGEGSSVAHNKYYDSSNTNSDATLYSSSLDKPEEGANETYDADGSNMDLSSDGDDDVVGYEVFMHNKSTATPNFTYLSPMVTSSSIDFIQTLLDETPANELMDFMSHPVYNDAQTTLVVHNPEGNPKLTSYISGASKESITLDQQALDAQDAEPSFHKRSHDNQDSPNNHDGENKKKQKRIPSTVAIAKKLKAIIQKDELTIADLKAVLTEAKWNSNEDDVSKPRSFEQHMSKYIKPLPSFHNNDFYYLVNLSTKEKHASSITKHYATRYHIQDLPKLSLNDVEDMYLLQVHNKLHHLLLEFVKGFNNALILFIIRVMIQNMVKDIQLVVKSYQQTLNLTKPMMFFEGIDQRIPFIMSGTHKGVVYLNQHNIKSFMKLSKVKKFSDGTHEKIHENLFDMVKKNKLGTGNK
uniref:Uncharacterized protein n=1 Tax=Tanacetum cinerariifolium TaxID=118510 RepID=A0A6L2JN54_TANCI|nr:hypothetical protein [Tanacetum cinerariifolium]